MIGQYAHGNEPSHHVIYLFNAIGHENRTQEYVAKVMNELYKNEPAVFVATKIAVRCRMVCIQCDGILPRQSRQWKI